MIYTGIGSRQTPPHVLEAMQLIAKQRAAEGWTLRSGNAAGADTAFATGCSLVQGEMEIYLPWEGFNNRTSKNSGYIAIGQLPNVSQAMEIAAQFHPNWGACSRAAKKLHTRNVYQIAGWDLNTPTDEVICWSKGSGGTEQALRIAYYLDIPIRNLYNEYS